MTFWEALIKFKEAADGNREIGIRAVSWAKLPCKKFICLTGVDGCDMFGTAIYDFMEKRWTHTWSVFMPYYNEAFEEWEIVPDDIFNDFIKHRGISIHDPLMELFSNTDTPDDPYFLQQYNDLYKRCYACSRAFEGEI